MTPIPEFLTSLHRDGPVAERVRRFTVALNRALDYPLTRTPDGRNAILMYHSLENPDFSADLPASKLESDLRFLDETPSVELVDLPEVLSVESGTRKVAVTFDDGYKNFYSVARPILRKYDAPATVFLNPDFVGDRNRELIEERHTISSDERIVLSDGEVTELVDDPGIRVGNHTATHPRLATLDRDELRAEILGGKSKLEDRYGISVERFCYPYGNLDERVVDVVRRSHDLAVTTVPYTVGPDSSPHELPRVSGNLPGPAMRWELTKASDLAPFVDQRQSHLYPE